MAIDGETIVVGANRDSFLGRNYVGSAYTFSSTGGHEQTGKLVTSDGLSEDRVGWDVAVGGAEIAVAADLDDLGTSTSSSEGSVYLFDRTSPLAERTEKARITAPVPERYAGFGSGVDMDGTTLIVGSRSATVGTANANQGSATIFYTAGSRRARTASTTTATGRSTTPTTPATSRDDAHERGSAARHDSRRRHRAAAARRAWRCSADDKPLPPRIVRPRTQPPVEVTKERVMKFATVWDCVETPSDTPCKTWAWVTIAYFEDARGSAKAKPKRRRIGATSVTIGSRRRVTVKLSKAGFKLLKRRKTLKAQVEIGMSRKGAPTTSTTVPVTLKAPRR